MRRTFPAALLVIAGIVLVAPVSSAVGSQPAADMSAAETTLVVDIEGEGDYRSIQAAVDAATAGDTVEVRPGTYDEQITIDKTITLVAPSGATLDGSTAGNSATAFTIPAGSSVEPVIEGFTVTSYEDAIVASETAGAWTIRSVTIDGNGNDGVAVGASTGGWTIQDSVIRESGDEGIDAENTTGDWTVRNVTIRESGDDAIDADGRGSTSAWTINDSVIRDSTDDGIDLDDVAGAWTIRDSVISGHRAGIQVINASGDWQIVGTVVRNNSQLGINALDNTGDWTIRRSNFQHNRLTGISAARNSGAWTIEGTTIADSAIGVHAQAASGAWTITSSTIRNTPLPQFYLEGQGTAIFAFETTGAWVVHDSAIVDAHENAINATAADPQGDATGNWWGDQNGSTGDGCAGNVDCSEHHSKPPSVPDPPTVTAGFNTETADTASSISWVRVGVVLIAVLVGVVAVSRHRRTG